MNILEVFAPDISEHGYCYSALYAVLVGMLADGFATGASPDELSTVLDLHGISTDYTSWSMEETMLVDLALR